MTAGYVDVTDTGDMDVTDTSDLDVTDSRCQGPNDRCQSVTSLTVTVELYCMVPITYLEHVNMCNNHPPHENKTVNKKS